MTGNTDERLKFNGPPNRLRAYCPDVLGPAAVLSISADSRTQDALGGAVSASVDVRRITPTGVPELCLSLPRTTPPGIYAAMIDFGDHQREVILEIQPRVRSRLCPVRTRVSARANDTVDVSFEVCNTGNVEIVIPPRSAFLLASSELICRSVFATVRREKELQQVGLNGPAIESSTKGGFLDRLADEMLNAYGGTVTARIQSPARTVAPGEVRHLDATLLMPKEMLPEKKYWGLWSLHPGKVHRVYVDVVA